MEYEYKSIMLSQASGIAINKTQNETLNNEFRDGWEFVDSICQDVSYGERFKTYGPVLVVLRRKK